MKNGLRAFGLFLIFMCLFGATNAFAQSDRSGFELRAGIAVPIYAGASSNGFSGNALAAVGVGLDVQAMYRWTYFGLGVQQTITGIFAMNNTNGYDEFDSSDDYNVFEEGDGVFYGGTFFMLKEYIPFLGNHMITIGEGVGATYGAKLDHKKLYSSDSDVAFAIKGELGYTYFIEGKYGVGFNIDYTAALSFGNGIAISYAVTPSVVFDMVF